jgi:hypothetical protein
VTGLVGTWCRLAGRSGRRPGSRRSVRFICGGWYPKTLVSSHGPLSNIERGPRGTGLLIVGLRNAVVRDARRLGPPRQPPRVVDQGQSARAISQQKPASSRAIATATTPLGFCGRA